MKALPSGIAAMALVLIANRDLAANDFFVSPGGTTETGVETGTITNPWALATALAQPSVVKPGDTIWLRGGTYVGEFRSYLNGTARAPIVVRQYPGERATLDGNVNPSVLGDHVEVLTIQSGESAYAWFWGFEVMNSNPNRYNPTPGSNPPDQRGGGIYANAVGTKLINLIVHDTGVGIGFWSSATESEAYGNIVYYNGWTAPDRGHGHSIYTQNLKGTKTIKHNVLFSPFEYNLHAFGSSSSAFVNVWVEGNVWFRGGSLVGGLSGFSLSGTQVVGNYQWDSSTAVGYYSQNCNPFSVTGNYWVELDVVHPTSVMTAPYDPLGRVGFTLTSNTLVGALDGFTTSDYPNNTYYTNASPPTVNKLVVLPNAYEPGRATVVVYNWQNLASVTVDLAGVMSPGTLYEIRNAQNYYGPLVASGTYSGGSVTLPMTGLTPATPVGLATPASTGPAFAVFVVAPAGGTFGTTRILPVVVDVAGLKSARFTTEVTLSNRGVTPASTSLTYTPAPQFGGAAGSVTESLPPGRQLVIPDVISYLRSHGVSLGSGNQGGSLRVSFTGLSSPAASYAAARITSLSGSGRAGTALPSVRPETGFEGKAIVFGLRESDRERSNVAFVNLEVSGSMTLSLTAFSGTDGRVSALAPVTLGPGEWRQVNSPLGGVGFENGWVAVERTAGTGRFFTYGAINDNVTNDGAFVPPVESGAPAEDEIVPVIVESGTFESDLVLTNPGGQAATATLTYVESLTASTNGAETFQVDVPLAAFEQRLIPSAIDFLRRQGLQVGPRGTSSYGGAVQVSFSRGGLPAPGHVGAATYQPAPQGGRYGLFYNGVPVSRATAGDAWIFGLRQDGASRSNVAIASAGDAGEAVTCRLEIYDGDTGQRTGELEPFVVPPRGWIQFSRVLSGFGVSNGYARVVGWGGADRLVVYGVVNDGGTPVSGGTNDGSFIPSPTD